MDKVVDYFKRDELAKSGSIIFIASLIAGFFNYIYQIYMGRVLGPEEYGTLGALFAILYIFSVISLTLGTSTTRFVSKFIGEGYRIGFFIKGFFGYLTIFGVIISVIFLIFHQKIMDIFKISDYISIYVLILIIFLTCIEPIMVGTIRGVKRFATLGFINISNTSCKLIFGILLVTIGLGVAGALIGVAIGILVGMIISFIFMRRYMKPNNPHDPDFRYKDFYLYSFPVMIAMLSYSVPSNFDVILAKYFFSPIDAGIYTSVSILGKIIFFFPGAIGTVMFPIITEKHIKGENCKNILKKSILYTGLLSGSLTLLYILMPQIVIGIFGDKYADAVNLIGYYGLTMLFFSIIGIILNYHLAIKNTTYVTMFAGFTIIEIGGLMIFNSSLIEMIETLFVANILFLLISIIYTFDINTVMRIFDIEKNKNG